MLSMLFIQKCNVHLWELFVVGKSNNKLTKYSSYRNCALFSVQSTCFLWKKAYFVCYTNRWLTSYTAAVVSIYASQSYKLIIQVPIPKDHSTETEEMPVLGLRMCVTVSMPCSWYSDNRISHVYSYCTLVCVYALVANLVIVGLFIIDSFMHIYVPPLPLVTWLL